jgi:hypothetical protein
MRQALGAAAVFIIAVVALQRLLRYVCENCVEFDCPYYWPVSIFQFRMPTLAELAVAGAVVAAFAVITKVLEVTRYRIELVALSGCVLILGLSLIHGVEVGLYAPIAGDAQSGILVPYSLDGQEYLHDALKIADPVDFFRRYNEIQPTLHSHGHTHPPGAVLTLYFLNLLLGNPGLIAIVIAFAAMIPTAFFVYRLVRTENDGATARFIAFLMVLLPAVQIYYLATIDALITALLTGAVYLFCFSKSKASLVGTWAMLFAAFMLTHVSLFILPVIVGFDLIVNRSLKRSAIVIGSLVATFALVYAGSGYNWVQSLRTASAYENPRGFMLFVDPANYFFTRIEDVAEILFFFGPILLVLLIRGLKDFRLRPLDVLTALACLTMGAMFLTGAWRTGETARACAFIYPYLLFPVARVVDQPGGGAPERFQLATLVFVQAVGMQLFGNFHW